MRVDDHAARRRAATDFATNLVVLAGAGTGKTSLLVERVLGAVGSATATMDRIAAITFTEKAAGEMRERIAIGLERLRALARGEAEPDPQLRGEADRAHAWLIQERSIERELVGRRALEAMEQLDASTVVTIHAFCAALLREFPLQAGVDPGFAVDSGQHAERLLEEAWERFLLRELGPQARRAELWRALLDKVELPELKKLAWGLADFGIPEHLLDDPRRGVSAIEALSARARELVARIDSVLARQRGLSPAPDEFLRASRGALRALIDAGLEGFRRAVEADGPYAERLSTGDPPSANKKLEGVPAGTVDELCRVTHKLGQRLIKVDEGAAAHAVEALAPFVLEFREGLLRAGVVSFDGLLGLARDLLRDHPDVRSRLKARFGMLLVDEFQDTDPVQYEIVLLLGEAPEGRAAEAFEARLEPGRLFIVGDTKQSIYRFRRADYAACRRAIERIEGEGGAALALTENFRSVPEIVGPVNRLFEDAAGCWTASPYQPPYVPIRAHRAAAANPPRVELWTVSCKEEGRDLGERREAEGRAVAQEIERLQQKDPQFHYRRVTILLRSFTDIGHYLRPLRERGIPFVVDGGRDFLKRPEVEQLLAAFRTLSRPSDQPALLAFLRSPAGGVSDVELARYAAEGGRWSWSFARPDANNFPGVARSFALLRELRDETRHQPADVVIRHLVERTYMLPLGAAAFEGAQRVANLQKLAAAAGELARDGRLSLEGVVDALVEGRLEDIQTDRPLADDRAEAVRITSIHRMKGLENDCIFFPGLSSARQHARGEGQAVALMSLPDGRQALAVGAGGAFSSCRVLHEMDEMAHDEAEEIRVLYVALTRARERLVLLARDDAKSNARANDLSAWGYRVGGGKGAPPLPAEGPVLCNGLVLHRRVEPVPRGRPRAIEPLPETSQALELYARTVARLDRQPGAELRSPSRLAIDDMTERAMRPSRSRDLGQAVGHAVHRTLESWDGRDGSALNASLEAACIEAGREHGIDVIDVEREATTVLGSFRSSELARLFAEREQLGRELPLLCATETETWHGSIDLLYRDVDGSLVVADYKTDDEGDEAVLRARHAPQLAIYAKAVQQALSLPDVPRTELWLLRTGRRLVFR